MLEKSPVSIVIQLLTTHYKKIKRERNFKNIFKTSSDHFSQHAKHKHSKRVLALGDAAEDQIIFNCLQSMGSREIRLKKIHVQSTLLNQQLHQFSTTKPFKIV